MSATLTLKEYVNRLQSIDRVGYAASAWGCVYGGLQLYWALGGQVGFSSSVASDLGFVAGWVSVVLCAIGAVVALATVQSWGRIIPRWLLLGPAWIGAAFLATSFLYLERYLRITKLLLTPGPLMALAWIGTALSYQYRTRGRCQHCGRGTDRATEPI